MNLFQKDLSLLDNKMKDNRIQLENLNKDYQVLKDEKANLHFLLYENGCKINKLSFAKKFIIRNNKNINKYRENKKKVFTIYMLFEIISLILFAFLNNKVNILLGCFSVGVGGTLINVCIMNLYNKKIKSLKLKNETNSEGLTIRMMDDNIDYLEKQKYYLQSCIEDKEAKLVDLNEKLEQLNIEYAKLSSDYKVILEYYEGVLRKFNCNQNTELKDEEINKEHHKGMSVILKKLYNKKND